MVAETASSAAAVSLSGSEITFDRLQKFWNDLPPQARQELLRIDKQTLIEQARKNLYCSRCNGLLLECFTQIVIYGKSLQQEGSGVSFPRRTNESRIAEGEPDKIQDPTVHPWGCLATTKDGIITLLDCFINAKSLQALQNVFNSARAREREREMLYPDACGGGGRGWISQGMANYSRSHGTRETCALHTAHLSCDTLVNFWSALSEETRSSLLRMKEEDFIERLMYRFDSKRFCRDCRRNVIREFKELKELKRMRKEPRCTSWFCVADTNFQCEVFEDTVLVDWHQSFSETDGPYHRFEWAIGTDEGKSDVLDFEDVGMNRQVHRNGLNLDQFDDYFVTLRAWGPDDHCTELCVKAHALKGQSCVHHRLIVGDGFVTITKGESIRSFFEYAEEAEEEDEDDAMDRDGNDLDGDGSHPQKHAKSPELAREFLLDAATVIFKEQIEKAFREGTARQNAHSVFVSLALELLEERVHVACKEIITLEKQTKLLEEEEREKREEEERRMRRRIKEREKKHRRKERLKEKGRDKEKKLFQSKLSDDVSPSSLSNSSTSTNDESPNTPESRDSASEDEDNVAVVEPCSHDTAIDQSSSREDNGQINDDHYDIVSEFAPTDCTDSLISEQHKSSRRKMRLRKDFPQDQASCCWYDGCQDESGSSGDQHWQSRERTRNSARSGSSVFSSNNRTRDRYDYNPCSCGHQEDYRIKDSYFSSAARSGREIKMVRRIVVEKPRLQYRRCYPLDSIILSKGSRVGSSPNKIVSAKQVWEPMDARKKSSLGNTNNGSETVDNLDQPKAAECNKDIDECQKLDTGCEPLAEICSEGSEVVDKLDTDQPSEKGGKNEAVCHNGSDVVDKQDCCSADDGDSEHDTGLMTNSASSDSSSCPTEADSRMSSLTSLSAQNTESSSASDSEESSEGNDIIAGHPSTGIASRSLLETCAGNGFREYQPKAIHPSNYDRIGFSMPSFHDQSVHHQTMHVPPYSSATMAFHNHSWAPLTNGYFPYPHPGHFYSSPVGYGVAGKQHVNYPMQYNNAYPFPASAFGCMPPPSIHKTAPSFSVIPPPPPYRNAADQVGIVRPLGDTNPDKHHLPSKLKPMGLKGDTKDTGKPADNSAPFSLFQFNLPIAPPAPPSSKGEKSGELVSRTSVAQVQVQPCSREEENIKVYKLFSTRNGGILPFL